MGYTTEFEGRFELDKPLSDEHFAYLKAFNETRRMKRNVRVVSLRKDEIRWAVKLDEGVEGGYFVGDEGDYGQSHTSDIIDYNEPPAGQPGLWCKWTPSEDRKGIEWDGNEKFYDYTEWLEYIIDHFLKPWGYVLNGEVEWSGEERGDLGKIVVKNNVVKAKHGVVTYK